MLFAKLSSIVIIPYHFRAEIFHMNDPNRTVSTIDYENSPNRTVSTIDYENMFTTKIFQVA